MDKYYLAFYRIDYEGIMESSMALFSTKDKAENHIQELKEEHGPSIDTDIMEFTAR